MKKLLALTLALLMVFALAACGNNDTPGNDDPLNRDPGTSQTDNQGGTQGGSNNTADVDIDSILAGNGSTDVVWGEQDEATKQAIIEAAEEEGLSVSFGSDGSMTLTDEDGNKYIQNSDGTWSTVFADGGSAQIGGNWPKGGLADIIPAASFNIVAASNDSETCAISFSGATLEQIKTYVQQIKNVGFTDDVEETDTGETYYSYYALNSAGYSVQVFYTSGASGVTVEAPDEDFDDGGSAMHELFDIAELQNVSSIPAYAKKAIGSLRYCRDETDRNSTSVAYYVLSMEYVTSSDYTAFITNLTANGGQISNSGGFEVYSWDWGNISVGYDEEYKELYVEISVSVK